MLKIKIIMIKLNVIVFNVPERQYMLLLGILKNPNNFMYFWIVLKLGF